MNELGDNSAVVQDAVRQQWLLFQNPVRVICTQDLAAVMPSLREIEIAVERDGLHAAGFLAYEAAPAFDAALATRPNDGFPLLWFALYRAPEFIDGPRRTALSAEPMDWQPDVTAAEYGAALAHIKERIRAGDTYQVNYSYRLRAPAPKDVWGVFARMVRAQSAGHAAYVQTPDWILCSASPELFFHQENDRLVSRPMKGTQARGAWPADDLLQAEKLRQSAKDRAENVMIVDMVRNDLGRVAQPGSVQTTQLFAIEQYPTVWQMTSTVGSRTGAPVSEVLRALFPAASITGAPKAATMQIIADLEGSPRRIYTGAIGIIAPGRRAQFNVAIRTVLVDRRRRAAEYGVGGGVVWDSQPDAEYRECRTKARVLSHEEPDFALLETLRWSPDEGFSLLEGHLRRLAGSAGYFLRPFDEAGIRRALADAANGFSSEPMRVRLLLAADGTAAVEAAPLKDLPQPCRVRIARHPVARTTPWLYHKTTCRTVYEEALRTAGDCDDVLLWNEGHEMTESCIGNLVIEKDGRLVTPPVESGLLPGVFRERLLAQLRVREQVLWLTDVLSADQCFLCNAVRGLWPIKILAD